MKKGRPAYTLSVLAERAKQLLLTQILLTETGTLGVRSWPVSRFAATRESKSIEIDNMQVGLKVTKDRIKVEFDDAAALATKQNRPVRTVINEVEQHWKDAADK